MKVAPFLVRENDRDGDVFVLLGFTDEPSPRAICVGQGIYLIALDRLTTMGAGADWPGAIKKRLGGDEEVTGQRGRTDAHQ